MPGSVVFWHSGVSLLGPPTSPEWQDPPVTASSSVLWDRTLVPPMSRVPSEAVLRLWSHVLITGPCEKNAKNKISPQRRCGPLTMPRKIKGSKGEKNFGRVGNVLLEFSLFSEIKLSNKWSGASSIS